MLLLAAYQKRVVILLTLTEQDGVATLTLNRPPVNAMNVEFVRHLSATHAEVCGVETERRQSGSLSHTTTA